MVPLRSGVNTLKSDQQFLPKLYAILLLAAISISILPVNLLHRHGAEHVLLSADIPAAEHIAPGHQPFCPVCSCILTQHYPPTNTWEIIVCSFPFSFAAPLQQSYLPAAPLLLSLRAPPAC